MSAVKVLQLGSPAGLYGAERWILALVRHLDRSRFEPIVGVIRDDPAVDAPLCAQARAFGMQDCIIEAPGRVNWSAVKQLREFIVREGVQVLHTHFYKTDLIGLFAVRGTSCRLVTTPHGWSTQAGLMLRLYEGLDRAIFPFFDAVAPLSDTLYEELKRVPGVTRRLQLIRNGVDISEIDAVTTVAPEMLEWRQRGAFVIGYVGQLIHRKGIAVLLEAFAQLAIPGKKLALLGEGPQRAEFEAQAARLGIANDVRFFGFRSDRLELLRGFDVIALPSRLEGIPRCLMEAMAANVAIVASDIPGCNDLVTHGRTGLLFPMDDVSALRTQLERSHDAGLRADLTRAGREHVLANYSAAAMARQYQDLYAKVIDVRSRG